MKVRPSVKPICDKCRVIKRKGVVRVICTLIGGFPDATTFPIAAADSGAVGQSSSRQLQPHAACGHACAKIFG